MTTPINNRYRIIKRLGSGGMGTVYRVYDRLNREDIALKRVSLDTRHIQTDNSGATMQLGAGHTPNFDYRLALAQEYRTLASLRHPHIISVLDYGFDDEHRPYFTMELMRRSESLLQAAKKRPQRERIELLLQVLQALAYLHRRGVIHRDLKPDNVLVRDGQVKVLDFGLALTRGLVQPEERVVGTLGYIAPELLTGEAATVQSDLYSFGTIAYEILGGDHPFNTASANKLLNDVLYTPADIDALDIDVSLTVALGRLLSKDPAVRYDSPREVMEIFARAASIDAVPETPSIRESFLQAADLIGRDEEIAKLRTLLNETVNGSGSAWLIGGESGVGKSRLVEELRAMALVRGAQVLVGQAVNDVGTPFHLWRNVLRQLALQTPLSVFEASLLKPLVPDIGDLIGQYVPDAPPVDPSAAQTRFLLLVEDIFRRQQQPVVLLLEDLQWGGQSLTVLERLSRFAPDLPLLIVGTYRDDELPGLPQKIPAAQVMPLERLSQQKIAELSASMLGDAVGRDPAVVQLVQRESEGNVFFIVEIVRALAEDAGRMDRIGQGSLPSRIFADGIHSIIQRRLRRVSDADRQLLQVAAVAGRELDLNLLRQAAPEDDDLSAWLSACSDASVLDVKDDRWRFAHDKLREGLLAEMSAAFKSGLHEQVARAIESAYPDDRSRAGVLAFHWREAGDADKESHYARRAGAQAYATASYKEAADYFGRALMLSDRVLLDDVERGVILGRLASIAFITGDVDGSLQRFGEALDVLGEPLPDDEAALDAAMQQLGLREVIQRQLPAERLSHDAGQRELTLSRIYRDFATTLYWANRPKALIYASLANVRAAEKVEDSPELLIAYGNLAATLGVGLQWHEAARHYDARVHELAARIDEPLAYAGVLTLMLSYLMGQGDWDTLGNYIETALHIVEKNADYRNWGDLLTHAANKGLYDGNYARGAAYAEQLRDVAERSGNRQHMRWSTFLHATYRLYDGDFDGTLEYVLPLVAQYERAGRRVPRGLHLSLATVYLRTGDYEQARYHTERVGDLLARANQRIYAASLTISEYAEACFRLLERTPDDDELREMSQKAVKLLAHSTGLFKVAVPKHLLWQGVYEVITGSQQEGINHIRQAATEADSLAMPYIEAIARQYLARFAGDAAERERALALFKQMNLLWHIRNV